MTTVAAPAVVVRYEPRGAALTAFTSKAPELLLSGAAGTGKSVAALTKLHLACLAKPKVRALIVRKTHASLTASTLVTFREKVAKEAIAAGALHFYGGSAQEPPAYRYSNGSIIIMGGLDKATRLLSTEFDLAFVDEAIEVTDEDLDTIVSRLRNGVLSYQQLIMATNPGPPTHHLKRRADAGRCLLLYSKHEDNPRLFAGGQWTEYGQTYLARLDSLTGARYHRMRWGKWVSAEGLVYEDWDEAVHLIEPFDVPATWTRWVGIDFGYTNPFVAQLYAEDPDGRLYLIREWVRTRMLVEDHAVAIRDRLLAGQPRPRGIITDHDAEDRATLEKHLGMSTIAAKKTVSDGIQALQSRLRVQPDGRARLYVFRDALIDRDPEMDAASLPIGMAEEVTGYVWAVKPGNKGGLKEEPEKANDHSMDTGRYVVAERDLLGRPQVRFVG